MKGFRPCIVMIMIKNIESEYQQSVLREDLILAQRIRLPASIAQDAVIPAPMIRVHTQSASF